MPSATLQPKTDAAVDEKLGLIAVTLPFHVKPVGGPWLDLLTYALTFRPTELDSFGLATVKRIVKQDPGGGFDVSFNVEGHFNPSQADGEEFSLDGTTSEDRIESHPDILSFISKYQGERKDDGSVVFPLTFSIDGQQQPNPMHGVKSYYVPGCAWTRTTVAVELPVNILDALGCIDQPPSGLNGQRPPSITGHRNWIKLRVKADWRGNIWKISETWMLSGPGGWNPDIYRYR